MPTLRAGGGPPTRTTTQLADYNVGCVVQSLGGLDSAKATPIDNRDANLGIQIEFSGGAPCSETPPSPHPEVHPDEQSLPAEPRTLSTRLARRDRAEIAPRSRRDRAEIAPRSRLDASVAVSAARTSLIRQI